MVRWLVRGAPRHIPPARRTGDRLIAANLGSMGQYLLDRPRRPAAHTAS
jgi:hypothetical protein